MLGIFGKYGVSTLNLVEAPEPDNGLILIIALLAAALLLGPRIVRRRQLGEM